MKTSIYFLFRFFTIALIIPTMSYGDGYWQQKADYKMSIELNAENHNFTGSQTITYTNNSPDTLNKVFFHLYFNAFQPGSMMDVRSRTIADPDRRVKRRIYYLQEDEIGIQEMTNLKMNGKKCTLSEEGTILIATLPKPILPGKTVKFESKFKGQVPLQVRRSGRDNKEGIDYSMAQWYPKLCEYDYEGWHANPYIGREFHSIWGDFDVEINVPANYVVAATGQIQNPNEVGHGYETRTKTTANSKTAERITWKFKAENVIDFVWAADPDYKHDIVSTDDGLDLHFFYQTDTLAHQWDSLKIVAVLHFENMSEHFGKYPYKSYSVIQGGDGAMEYPMATLMNGQVKQSSLISSMMHEVCHSWFQMILATNESKLAWMDEGFTSYAKEVSSNIIYDKVNINPIASRYRSYFALVASGLEEPLTTHSDYFNTNRAYSTGSYTKGAMVLTHLSYILGESNFKSGIKSYFDQWKFKHPTDNDFKRVFEKKFDVELDWFFNYWIGTTRTIDYGIKSVNESKGSTKVILERAGNLPMPLDVLVTLEDGQSINYQIPLRIMQFQKSDREEYDEIKVMEDWPWTYPHYELSIDHPLSSISTIELDPSTRMADTNRGNNVFPFGEGETVFKK